jgi:hypothetical protein
MARSRGITVKLVLGAVLSRDVRVLSCYDLIDELKRAAACADFVISCQTGRMSARYNDELVGRIAEELAGLRQHGPERISLEAHDQRPLAAPELQLLAQVYVRARGLAPSSGTAEIRDLLAQALDELSRQGRDADAELIRSLLFDDSVHIPSRFRERRAIAFRTFAEFLPQFVHHAERESTGLEKESAPSASAPWAIRSTGSAGGPPSMPCR